MRASLLLALLLPGCTLMPPFARRFGERVAAEWEALLSVLQGGRSPLAAHALKDGQKPDDPERRARNAETLQEMFKVIYRRDIQDPKELVGWIEAMNQGASVEGIYNGLTRSSAYRQIESQAPAADPRALAVFLRELLRLEASLPAPLALDAGSARPLAAPVPLGASEPSGAASPGSASPAAVSPPPGWGAEPVARVGGGVDPERRARELERLFARASVFTLKRVLGEAALQCFAAQKARDKLAEWYGGWAAALGRESSVDFGLALRNKPDEGFHRDWAKRSPEDRVLWEVLNRLHRILNEMDRTS